MLTFNPCRGCRNARPHTPLLQQKRKQRRRQIYKVRIITEASWLPRVSRPSKWGTKTKENQRWSWILILRDGSTRHVLISWSGFSVEFEKPDTETIDDFKVHREIHPYVMRTVLLCARHISTARRPLQIQTCWALCPLCLISIGLCQVDTMTWTCGKEVGIRNCLNPQDLASLFFKDKVKCIECLCNWYKSSWPVLTP